MSLVSLNSNGQRPDFFSCHFPQPIHIKPYSQVCLLKFLHFRDTHVYNITSANNLLLFCIGNTTFDGIRQVRIPLGQYSGDELAAAIELQMNLVLQQQHYEWACTFTPEDDTTSPPTRESFTISYSSLATPAEVDTPDADMNQLVDYLDISSSEVSLTASGELEIDGTYKPELVMRMPKGVLTNAGEVAMDELRFSGQLYDDTDPLTEASFGFDDLTFGMCRTELSSLVNENPNLVFDPELQDLHITANANGLVIGSIKIAGNTKVGSSGYAESKECRRIESGKFKFLVETTLGLTAPSLPLLRFRLKYTLLGSGRRVVVQLQYDDQDGSGYRNIADGGMGNDGKGDPILTTYTVGADSYPSTIWVSDQEAFNDRVANPSGGFTSTRVQNLVITKKAPFLPTFSIVELPTRIGPPNLDAAGVQYQDASANDADFSEYTGTHDYDYELNIDDGSGTVYYFRERIGKEQDPFKFDMSTSDVPFAGTGSALFDPDNHSITITLDGGGAGPVLTLAAGSQVPETQIIQNTPFGFRSILNPNLRPLTNQNVLDGTQFEGVDEVIQQHYASQPDTSQSLSNGVDVGADLGRQAILFLRQLNAADVAANSGAPANLKQGQSSGTIGSTIGSVENIIVAQSSTGRTVFESGQSTQRIAKDTILTVSIPELAGVKSFNGIDQGAGKMLSGEGKNIAVLPREEFEQRGENTSGSLVYVAPFENWIDINNGSDMYINELTCEVRQPAGQLASDLRPDTICQIKFRQDPTKLAEAAQDKRFEDLSLALSAATQTGQILSQTMYSTGS